MASVSNVSVDLFRAEIKRNQFVFGFGSKPNVSGDVLTVTQKLTAELGPGLYVLSSATLCWNNELEKNAAVRFNPVFFAIIAGDDFAPDRAALTKMIEHVSAERRAHAQKPILTTASDDPVSGKRFRILILGVGCLLHTSQQLEGFVIVPLGRGFSYGRMLEIVNQTLKSGAIRQLNFDPQLELQHEQATPAFLIDYFCVVGRDHSDALDHCRKHADLMFDLLALDRGHKPREFFCMAIDHATGNAWHLFLLPGYRGNLVCDFNPVSTANLIETVTPRLERHPFLRLLVRSYAEATAERDEGIALLRAWTVMELLADREILEGQAISHPNGTPILRQDGKPKTTKAKEARVYEFIRRTGVYEGHFSSNIDGIERRFLLGADESHPGFVPGTVLISLWDVVRAAYAIRNCVAHEGYFSPDQVDVAVPDQVLASDLIKNTLVDPRRWIRNQAHLAVRRELNKE